MHRTHRITRSATTGALVLSIGLAVGLALACGTAGTLREAQDAFNTAAVTDNQLKGFTGDVSARAGLVAQRDGGYAAVIQSIDAIPAADRRKLQSQNLWGNALALKAISHWRLGQYDLAKAAAVAVAEDPPGTRDAAVLGALPGLIMIDEAYAKLAVVPPDVAAALALLDAADENIEAVRASLAPIEPVQGYLIEAQLAGHTNRVKARAQDGLAPGEISDAQASYCDLRGFLDADQSITPDEQAILDGWENRLGLNRALFGCS